jgi:hypothetical protein
VLLRDLDPGVWSASRSSFTICSSESRVFFMTPGSHLPKESAGPKIA